MNSKSRMTGEERKRSIVKAASVAFAEHGYVATSVKDIAKAADVSQALIYKHFPGKEALYEEVQEYIREVAFIGWSEVEPLGPGAGALVAYAFFLMEVIMFPVRRREADQKIHEKLLFRSLVGDTKYARMHFKTYGKYFSDDFIVACYKEAERVGEIVPSPIVPRDRIWFVHHLFMALNLCHLSGNSAYEYDVPRWQMTEQAVLFCLRGMGLTDQAIEKYFQPDSLRALVHRLKE